LTQVIDGEQAVQTIGYLMGEIGSREGFDHEMISFREFSTRISQESAIRRLEVADQRWWDDHDDPRSKQNACFTVRVGNNYSIGLSRILRSKKPDQERCLL